MVLCVCVCVFGFVEEAVFSPVNEGSSFVVMAAKKYLNKKTNQERVYVRLPQFQVTVLHRRDVKVARIQNNWLHPIYTPEQREVNVHMLTHSLACLRSTRFLCSYLHSSLPPT